MGGDKPKNPLDAFWEQLGDKEKTHVRSYRSNKRDLQIKSMQTNGRPRTNPRKRRD